MLALQPTFKEFKSYFSYVISKPVQLSKKTSTDVNLPL